MRQTIIVHELAPPLNDMLREHWGKRHRSKKQWAWLIKAQKPQKHEGSVNIQYTRVSTAPMDLDNLGGSFKCIGDALVRCGVISDDSPDIVRSLTVQWQKAGSQKDQRTEIIIEDVEKT